MERSSTDGFHFTLYDSCTVYNIHIVSIKRDSGIYYTKFSEFLFA